MYIHDTATVIRWLTDTTMVTALRQELGRIRAAMNDTAHAETTSATADAWYDESGVVLKMRNKPKAPVVVPVFHEREEARHEETRAKTEIKVVTEYRIPAIVSAAAWFGLAALLGLIVRAVIRLCLRR